MKNIPSECEELKCIKRIVLEENKSKITFLNPHQNEIVVVKVDGCVFKKEDEDIRCDYAILPKEEFEIYVELKGSDIPHAVEQLEATIKKLSKDSKSIEKLCFIVSTRVPKQGNNIQQLKVKFKNKYNSEFRVKNLQDEFDLSDL
jgi:aspartokinase